MFETAELGHTISREQYDKEEPELRSALLEAQHELLERQRFPLVILLNGIEGAGKSETVNLLSEWMDPRHLQVHAMSAPTDEEDDRPPMWRYWRVLPPRGKTGIFFGSWYADPLHDRVQKRTSASALDRTIGEILRFEQMLHDEGALILKFWLHLSKKAQKQRLESLEENPRTRWRVTDVDWQHHRDYDRIRRVSEVLVRETSTASAPWHLIEGTDRHYRSLAVGRAILDALHHRFAELDAPRPPAERTVTAPAPLTTPIDQKSLLSSLDLSVSLPKEEYSEQLDEQQGRLNRLTRHRRFRRRGLIAVFEGADAAGKGGSIRRVTAALDARFYNAIPIAAPTQEEKAQPYLWRFWRHIPVHGRVTLFDRSWYGRVLVERVEGFCAEADWMRAYSEINDFEEQLDRAGYLVVKFWLQISKEEQLKRFEERQEIEFKRFKITEEDWRNRDKWDAYQRAINDMIGRTSTDFAPWTLVEANDKRHARIKVLRTLADRLEQAL